jgi:two-component system KDP operon response regulator KdpE
MSSARHRAALGACRMFSAAPLRVLLVEPHTDTRDLYVLGLITQGFDVVTAHDGASAATAFATHSPTIVVSETRLPDGDEVALLSGFADAGVPVIGLTTAPRSLYYRFRHARLARLLAKPCGADELTAAIHAVLSLR